MNSIEPYLIFDGNCREAMKYYANILDGEITHMRTFAEAPIEVSEEALERIFDSRLEANGISIRASDNLPENEVVEGGNFSMFTSFSTSDEINNVYDKLAKDGQIWMALADSPTGKFGMVKDKFGYSWMLNWQKTS